MRTLPVSKAATELGLEESLILALLRLCSGRGGPLIHVMALLLGLKSSHMDLMVYPIMLSNQTLHFSLKLYGCRTPFSFICCNYTSTASFHRKMYHTSLEKVITERASKVTRVDAEFLKHWGEETAQPLDSRRQLNLWDHFIRLLGAANCKYATELGLWPKAWRYNLP